MAYSGVYGEVSGGTTPTIGAAAFRDRSGVFHPAVPASALAILISNLSDTTKTIDLGTIAGHRVFTPNDPNGIGQDDITIEAGSHRLVTFTLRNQQGLGLGSIAKQNANGLPVWDETGNNLIYTDNNRNGVGSGLPIQQSNPISTVETAPAGKVIAGENFQYTIVVANPAFDSVPNLVLSDVIPAHTTFVSATQSGGPAFTLAAPTAANGGTFSASLADFAAGASASFVLTLHVDPALPAGRSITDTASATSPGLLPAASNVSTTTVTTAVSADIAVTLSSAASAGVYEGHDLVYTLDVANNGPSDSHAVSFDFPFPNITPSGLVPNDIQFVSAVQVSGPAFAIRVTPNLSPER